MRWHFAGRQLSAVGFPRKIVLAPLICDLGIKRHVMGTGWVGKKTIFTRIKFNCGSRGGTSMEVSWGFVTTKPLFDTLNKCLALHKLRKRFARQEILYIFLNVSSMEGIVYFITADLIPILELPRAGLCQLPIIEF